MTLPLAHIGHWYHALLYVIPVLLVGLGLWWSGRREAHERDERDVASADAAGPDAQD